MFRRTGTISAIVLSAYLLSGYTAPTQCKDSGSSDNLGTAVAVAAVVIAVVVVGTVVLVHEHNVHHRVKGCAFMGANGLEVADAGNGKRWLLTGSTSNIKPGDVVKVHGNRAKFDKSSPIDQTFVVEKLNKDYGACKVPIDPATPATPPAHN